MAFHPAFYVFQHSRPAAFHLSRQNIYLSMFLNFLVHKRYIQAAAAGAVLLLLSLPALATAQNSSDSFRVSPKRILLDNEAFGRVNVQNTGDTSSEFRVELRYMHIDEDGKVEQIEAEDAADAAWALGRNLRFGPRRFVLEPGGRQIIRLATRFAPDQPDGEYRAYIAVVHMPESSPPVAEENETGTLSLNLRFNRAIAVPIRVFKGELAIPAVEIEQASLHEDGSEISMRVRTEGSRTVAGNMDVYYHRNGSREGQKISTRSPRVAIYPEVAVRNLSIPIERIAAEAGGTLRIVYTGEENGADYTYAQQVIEL